MTTTRRRAGKSKDIFEEDGKTFFEFTDRTTAFDGVKKDEFSHKGEVCCRLSTYWFEILEKEGIPTHFRAFVPSNIMEVEPLEIIPINSRKRTDRSVSRRYWITDGSRRMNWIISGGVLAG
jgi:phosphoribosylaminoimidazole-succinocarboxamide synthase